MKKIYNTAKLWLRNLFIKKKILSQTTENAQSNPNKNNKGNLTKIVLISTQ